jgi:hypothetical protein
MRALLANRPLAMLLRSAAPSSVYFGQAFGRCGPNPRQSQCFNHAIDEARGFRVLNELVDVREPSIVSFGYGHSGVDVSETIAQNARPRQRSGLGNQAGAVQCHCVDASTPQQFTGGGDTVRPDQFSSLERGGQIQIRAFS